MLFLSPPATAPSLLHVTCCPSPVYCVVPPPVMCAPPPVVCAPPPVVCRYCEARRKVLLQHVYEGYAQGLWEFAE